MRPLAVANNTRLIGAPELPTTAETGMPGFLAASWYGVFLPVRVPADVRDRIYADLMEVVKAADLRESIVRMGLEPAVMNREEFTAFLKAELPKWGAIIRARNIKIE